MTPQDPAKNQPRATTRLDLLSWMFQKNRLGLYMFFLAENMGGGASQPQASLKTPRNADNTN